MRVYMSQASDRIWSFDMRTLHEYSEFPFSCIVLKSTLDIYLFGS